MVLHMRQSTPTGKCLATAQIYLERGQDFPK